MSFQAPDPRPKTTTPVRVSRAGLSRSRACVPVTFIDCSHIAWDGHDLVVISKFDVLRD
jgi:hypothetical protein